MKSPHYRRLALVSLLFAMVSCALQAPAPRSAASVPHRLWLDGQPLEVSAGIYGRQQPQAGDIAWACYGYVRLGPGGDYQLERDEHRYWRRHDDGRRTLFRLDFHSSEEDLALTKQQWSTLRGLTVSRWSPELEKRLTWLNPERCFVRFGPLGDLPSIANLPVGLRYLDLSYSDLEDLAGLEQMQELRWLCLPAEKTITSVEAIAALPRLQHLNASGTQVRDLSPLGGHPHLREVIANSTPIETLPHQRLPQLERLRATASGCSQAEANAMRRHNPDANISVTSQKCLLDATRSATGLRIRTGSTCHPGANDRQVFATDDANEVRELLDLFVMVERYSGHYMVPGCGQFSIAFDNKDGQQLLEIGLLGPGLMRASGVLHQPTSMADSGPLAAWLAARGVVFRH